MVESRVSGGGSTADCGERIDHAQTAVVLLVAEVFRIDRIAVHCLCGGQNGGVPIGELEALADGQGRRKQRSIETLYGKRVQLVQEFQRILVGETTMT